MKCKTLLFNCVNKNVYFMLNGIVRNKTVESFNCVGNGHGDTSSNPWWVMFKWIFSNI